MSVELKPMKLWRVEVGGMDCGIVNARSRSAAIADAWRSDAFSSYSFKDFITQLRPRAYRCAAAPQPDGYDYIRRTYGINPKIGQRVRLRNENGWSGKEGVVLYPGPSTAHVHVLVDGQKYPVIVHPANVELLVRGPDHAHI